MDWCKPISYLFFLGFVYLALWLMKSLINWCYLLKPQVNEISGHKTANTEIRNSKFSECPNQRQPKIKLQFQVPEIIFGFSRFTQKWATFRCSHALKNLFMHFLWHERVCAGVGGCVCGRGCLGQTFESRVPVISLIFLPDKLLFFTSLVAAI